MTATQPNFSSGKEAYHLALSRLAPTTLAPYLFTWCLLKNNPVGRYHSSIPQASLDPRRENDLSTTDDRMDKLRSGSFYVVARIDDAILALPAVPADWMSQKYYFPYHRLDITPDSQGRVTWYKRGFHREQECR